MKANESVLHKEMIHSTLGKVFVEKAVENSRTKVVVTVLDRGKGWDDLRQSYKGVRTVTKNLFGHTESQTWSRGENYTHGQTDEVHINSLRNI